MPKPAYRGFDAAFLRARRQELGWSQERLATAAGVYPTLVGKWENGHHVPDVATIARLARVLGVHPRAFSRLPVDDAELLDLRLWSGLSRAEASAATGISQRTLRWYEHGTRPLAEHHAQRLARAYGVTGGDVEAAWARGRDHHMAG